MRCLKRTLVALSDWQSASTIMVIYKDYIPQERNILSSYIQASSLLIIISFVVALFFLLVYGKLIPVNFSSKNSRKLARRSEQGYPPFQFLMNPPSTTVLTISKPRPSIQNHYDTSTIQNHTHLPPPLPQLFPQEHPAGPIRPVISERFFFFSFFLFAYTGTVYHTSVFSSPPQPAYSKLEPCRGKNY